MKVFLAGEFELTAGLATRIKRQLYSYYYHGFNQNNTLSREIAESSKHGIELFLDSGAYSAFTREEKITIDKYADFIHKHGSLFSVRANLDDIGDTGPKSWANLKALESLGCKVFPVFHQADDVYYLKMMLNAGYPFIALGGLVGSSRKVLQVWMDEIWGKYLTRSDGTPRLQVHGFGLTDQALIQRYPWYSVDSSAWLFTGMMGGCLFVRGNVFRKVIFSEDSPDVRNADGWHYKNLTAEQRRAVDEWLAPHGVTAEEASKHYSYRHLINAGTYQGMEALGVDKFVIEQQTLF